MRTTLGLALLVLAPIVDAQERTDFSGAWRLNAKLSDDVETKVEEATGPAQIKGGGQGEVQRLVPRPSDVHEVDRVQFRQYLMERIGMFDDLSIEQKAGEITIVHGEDDFRIFYFDREHTRNDRRGRKLTCRSRFEQGKLIVEEDGEDKTRIIHVLTLVPSRHQLVYGTRIESASLKQPLNLNLLYDQVE